VTAAPRRNCQCHPSEVLERCDLCLRDLAHDYIHWNGDFYQCEECSVLEGLVGYPGKGGFASRAER
jgi:hypothetical protein